MVRLFAVLVMLLTACSGAAAKPKPFIQIDLETREAFLGDTVVIEVRWSGLLDPIDFSVLERDAELLRETFGTRIAVVEGQVIEISSRRIELQPFRIGQLTFGPLEVDGITSNSVSIEIVEPRTVYWIPGEEDVRVTQTISDPDPWLQQQIVLDIEFMTRHATVDEVVMLPALDRFRVVPVFTERRTLDDEDGWAKTSWRYLLFPQRSGATVIAGARFAGVLSKSRAERGAFELVAPPIRLAVRPSAFDTNEWWVAASSLSLADDWSRDPTKLSAGDELDRVITISAAGVLPEQLPQIDMDETRGLTITPLGVERRGSLAGDQARATAAFRFRIRAMSPVPVFLDTLRLRWWNTVENRAAEAIIPARRIDIAIPDRDSLVESALREQDGWDRLVAKAAGFDLIVCAAAAVAAALALLAVFNVVRMPGVVAWQAARRVRRELTALAARGDTRGFHERVRMLARESGPLGSAARQALDTIESALFSRQTGMPDLHGLARRTSRAMRYVRKSAASETFPPL